MMRSGLAWAVGATAGLLLIGCGTSISTGDSDVSVASTDWNTIAPTTSTGSTVTTLAPVSTATVLEQQRYLIIQDDTSRQFVADKCAVTVEDLDKANKKTDGYEAFYPGLIINIPGGALAGCTGPIVPITTTTLVETDTGTTTPGSTTTTIADPCVAQTYEIASGDVPSNVASRFGVTVEQLDKANADTEFYDGFVVGITINIPGPDC
jgi:LysM repeat protein